MTMLFPDLCSVPPTKRRSDHAGNDRIDKLNKVFEKTYSDNMIPDNSLDRKLVSFQANKAKSIYRWYKYKEAFSADLVEYLLRKYTKPGSDFVLFDPFAGSGTTLFASSSMGYSSEGIELLPIGQTIIATKLLLDQLTRKDLQTLKRWSEQSPWGQARSTLPLPVLRITEGAYPSKTSQGMEKYLGSISEENPRVSKILLFALLCILESVSYTRKDGQYLRWDYRSGRRQGNRPFDKGPIPSFEDAIKSKLREILTDIQNDDTKQGMFSEEVVPGPVIMHPGSCLDILPTISSGKFDSIITSPPYCNRYDYTRTYALELALLGVDEKGLGQLRQQMLSCTVENRTKDLMQINSKWDTALNTVANHELLQTILSYLGDLRKSGELNNSGIPRMIQGYFSEMACVIAECGRVMKSNSRLLMVNDNVRYAGACISVDIILSDIAQNLGFEVEAILVLPKGKGNSSQQMGAHGRDPLRKCVYIWRKR